MEDQLSFVSILSLKELSLKRLAINLCNEPDILNSIVEFFTLFPSSYRHQYDDNLVQIFFTMSFNKFERWREHVESKVTDKITKLMIPNTLVKELLLIFTPVGLQIHRWKGFHEHYLRRSEWETILNEHSFDSDVELSVNILSKLCWTAGGNVDYRRTAEELIKCKRLDVVKQYILASMYCLDDLIPILWAEIPEKIQQKFYDRSKVLGKQPIQLEFCWPYILKGEEYMLNDSSNRHRNWLSFNQYAFADSARHGNKAAAEYFFQKLSPNEKEYSHIINIAGDIMRAISTRCGFNSKTFPLENMSESFFYILSLMNFEEQMNFVKRNNFTISFSFVDLPWNDILLKFAHYVLPFIPISVYDWFLTYMTHFFTESQYCFPKFFQEVFIHAPLNSKKEFVGSELQTCNFFQRLFSFQDSETIKVILRNLDVTDRYRLVSCKEVFKLFFKCLLNMKLDMVKICLQETILLQTDRESVETAFLGFLTETDRVLMQESKLVRERFLELLDEICPSAKRKGMKLKRKLKRSAWRNKKAHEYTELIKKQ